MTPGTARQNRFRTRMTTMPVIPTARAARFTCPPATPWAKSLMPTGTSRAVRIRLMRPATGLAGSGP